MKLGARHIYKGQGTPMTDKAPLCRKRHFYEGHGTSIKNGRLRTPQQRKEKVDQMGELTASDSQLGNAKFQEIHMLTQGASLRNGTNEQMEKWTAPCLQNRTLVAARRV